MKKYIVFSIIFLLIFTSALLLCGCKKNKDKMDDLDTILDRGYLIVGVKQDSPPFGFYKNEILQGIDIEIARAIANDIFKNDQPSNIKFVSVDAQNRIAILNSGEVDILVATMSINDKRRLIINFSNPYFSASQKLMVRKDSKISHINYFNTNGRIAVIYGTTGEKILHLIAPTARVIGVESYAAAIELLKYGNVDGILGDDCILAGYNRGDFKIINRSYTNEYYAVAVRKTEKSGALLEQINSTIAILLDEKRINYLKKQFIGTSVDKMLMKEDNANEDSEEVKDSDKENIEVDKSKDDKNMKDKKDEKDEKVSSDKEDKKEEVKEETKEETKEDNSKAEQKEENKDVKNDKGQKE